MKICLVSRELYPFQKAGIAVYVYNMAKVLSSKGHDVFLITNLNNKFNGFKTDEFFDNKIRVINVNVDESVSNFDNYTLAYSNSVYKELKKLTSEVRLDLIEFPDYFGEGYITLLYKKELSEFQNIPIILKLHTPTYECNELNQTKELTNSITMQEDFCIKNADYVYAISNAMKEKIENRLNVQDIDVVYNFTGINYKDKNGASDLIEHSKNKRYVLYVGRLERRKGVDLLVKAAINILNENNDINFMFIGQDLVYENSISMKKYLLDLIPQKFKENFIFVDPIPKENLLQYYKNAYISVFPSLWEGFGNVCVEAMSMGSAVIVSNKGGMMDIIDNGNYGLYFESGNIDGLIEKIKLFLNDTNLRNTYKELSLERSKYFSDDKLYSKQILYYKKVISKYKINGMSYKSDYALSNYCNALKKVDLYYDELCRVTNEWNNLKKHNTDVINETERVTNEWKKLKISNEELEKENIKLQEEIKRVTDEWKKLKGCNSELEIENIKFQKEIKRVIYEWEKLKISNENVNIINLELQKELNNLTICTNSKKWLIKKIFNAKGGK